MSALTYNANGFQLNGTDTPLISGEFHYFRVPKEDWKRRMELFVEAGGNCIATYVPWIIHEPTEGDIRFGDVGPRDLAGFLETAKEVGLKVLIRPGLYVYSEIVNSGLPRWLIDRYPDILARDIKGQMINEFGVSYLHPTFLEKGRPFFRAFADVVRPYMAQNGGPIEVIQVDNEIAGVHLWYGSMDYHPVTLGLGNPQGRYPKFLEKKYGTIEKLNATYETDFANFAAVLPIAGGVDDASKRRLRDYSTFYRTLLAEYMLLLATWLKEDGLDCTICHNSGNPSMNNLFPETVSSFKEKNIPFFLASDHYYNLNQGWAQNNPTPQYALKMMMSFDTLRALGQPPSALEMPAGSSSDTPPILANDLLACYLSNLAVGMKGVNYYVYTGGPNFEDTGSNRELYDYGAPVAADGAIRESYYAMKQFNTCMHDHAWMQHTNRTASVQIGFEWETFLGGASDYPNTRFSAANVYDFVMKGLLYSFMCSSHAGELVLLNGELDLSRPLIVPCAALMSAEAQATVRRFAEQGGKVLLLPMFPEKDLDLVPCRILAEVFSGAVFSRGTYSSYLRVEGLDEKVYSLDGLYYCEKLPEGATCISEDADGRITGFELPVGQGTLIWVGYTWMTTTFPQVRMLETLVERLGAHPVVRSSNRNIFTTYWADEEGHRTVFAMNLYSSPQKTHLQVLAGEPVSLQEVDFGAMEVKVIDL